MFRSIKTKILVLQMGLVLSVTVCLGIISYRVTFSTVRDSQHQNLDYIAERISEGINALITDKEQLLEKIGSSEAVTNYSKKQQDNFLVNQFNKYMPEFDILSYVNSNGMEELKVINGRTATEFSDISRSAVFEKAINNPNKAVSMYSPLCPEMGTPCMEFGFFNKSFFDEFTGVVVGRVTVPEIVGGIYEFQEEQSYFAILVDSEGTILACQDKDKIFKKITVEGPNSVDIISKIKNRRSDFGRATILGVDGYFVYKPVPKQSWSVVAFLPYEQFVFKLNALRDTILLVGLTILIAGMALSLFLSGDITEPILELVKKTALLAKGNFSQRIDIKSKDEIGTLAESFNQMVENLQKTTTSIVNLHREIAERHKAEKSLRKSENRFEEVAENSGDWIWEVNAEGLYTYSSPVVEKILGYKPQEIVGKKYFYDFFAADVKEKFKEAALQAFARQESFGGFVNPNVHRNGSVVILETYGKPVIDEKGNLCGYRGADRDITDRKKSEEAMQRLNEELERTVEKLTIANREIADFVYAAAHDLKAPLRAIGSLAGIMLTDYKDKMDEQGQRHLNMLVKRTERMSGLIKGIMRYSELSRPMEMRRLDLNKIIQEAIAEVDPPENIEIVQENDFPTIAGDRAHMIEVFQNLLNNAIRYMDKPKGYIRLGCVEQKDCWKFSIADNGCGIERKYFEQIFKVFQTLNRRDEVESTGIGLPIVRRIIEKYDGKIWVESEPQKGSTFFFTLPKLNSSKAICKII